MGTLRRISVSLPASSFPEDQASGLRKLFSRAGAQVSLVSLPKSRSVLSDSAVAEQVRLCADAGRTLLIDAARSRVPAELGAVLKFDFSHALAGECPMEEACAILGPALAVMSATRAFDVEQSPHPPTTVRSAIAGFIGQFHHVMVLLPPARLAEAHRLLPPGCTCNGMLVLGTEAHDLRGGLSLLAKTVRETGIGDFRVLFPGLDTGSAGRLSTAMSTLAMRHFGARLTAAVEFRTRAEGDLAQGSHKVMEKVC